MSVSEWERRIAERLAARDQGAFAEIYDRFSPFVHALARRVSRDRYAADDVVQEVFLALWQRPGRFDPERGSLRAWLGTVTHRASVAWVRKQVANRRRENNQAITSVVNDVEDTALRRVSLGRARELIAALPFLQRQAVELAYFENLTYREVAGRTGVPEGTAKSRLRRALRSIAEKLEPEFA